MSRGELAALLDGVRPRRGRRPKTPPPALEHQVVVPRYLWSTLVAELLDDREPFLARIAADGRSVEVTTTATVAERLHARRTS